MKGFLFLFLWCVGFALPTGSPTRSTYFHEHQADETKKTPGCDACVMWQEAISWHLSYYGDFTFNNYMERRENVHALGDIEQFSLYTNGGAVTLNVIDWFEFFAMLGATNFFIRTPMRVNASMGELFFSPRLSWSVGLNAAVWKCGPLAFGFKGQYFRTMPKIDAFFDYAGGVLTYFNDIEKAAYYSWQVNFGGSYTIGLLDSLEMIPHAAATYSGGKMGMRGLTFTNNGNTHKLLNLKEKKSWGYGIGLSAILNRKAGITVEGLFANQSALGISGELAF